MKRRVILIMMALGLLFSLSPSSVAPHSFAQTTQPDVTEKWQNGLFVYSQWGCKWESIDGEKRV